MARKRSPEARKRQKANRKARERISKRKEHLGAWAASSRRRKLLILSERQNHKCCYCGIVTWHPMIEDGIPQHKKNKQHLSTLEHVKARNDGGTYAWINLVMACSECNGARGDIPVEEFLKSLSYPPTAKPIAPPEKKLSPEAQAKADIKMGKLFRLLIIAAAFYPEDYARLMEDEESAIRGVIKGKRKNKKRFRHYTLHNIRCRIHGQTPIATHSPEAIGAIG